MYECHAKYVYFKMIKCISFTSMRAKRISGGGGDASSYNRNTSIKARKWRGLVFLLNANQKLDMYKLTKMAVNF